MAVKELISAKGKALAESLCKYEEDISQAKASGDKELVEKLQKEEKELIASYSEFGNFSEILRSAKFECWNQSRAILRENNPAEAYRLKAKAANYTNAASKVMIEEEKLARPFVEKTEQQTLQPFSYPSEPTESFSIQEAPKMSPSEIAKTILNSKEVVDGVSEYRSFVPVLEKNINELQADNSKLITDIDLNSKDKVPFENFNPHDKQLNGEETKAVNSPTKEDLLNNKETEAEASDDNSGATFTEPKEPKLVADALSQKDLQELNP